MSRVDISLLPSRPVALPIEFTTSPARHLRVALVNMPWARINAPSIQCGLLQSIARNAGHDCDTHYLNIEFAAFMGAESYDKLAVMDAFRDYFLGEWLFSYAAFGEVTPVADYLAAYPEALSDWSEWTDGDLDHLIRMQRETIPRWISECAARPVWKEYDVVGFTSTFLQNTAALALGKAPTGRVYGADDLPRLRQQAHGAQGARRRLDRRGRADRDHGSAMVPRRCSRRRLPKPSYGGGRASRGRLHARDDLRY